MKKISLHRWLNAIAAIAALAIATGCANGPTVNQNTIDSTAVVLRGAARDGAIVAMQDNADTRRYFELAAASLETFLTGKDYTPGALQDLLMSITDQTYNPWVQISAGTVIDLYQLYFGQYVKGSLDKSAIAKAFITAVQDGFNQALGKPVSLKAGRNTKAPAGYTGTGVLPRPVRR